jgi:hypothetical protein
MGHSHIGGAPLGTDLCHRGEYASALDACHPFLLDTIPV